MMFRGLVLTIGLIFFGASVGASDASRIISVTGTGQVSAEPDMATISIGVTQQDENAATAMALSADAATQVIAELQAAGLSPQDIQTSAVSLNPRWSDTRSSDRQPEITGFVADISVTARVRELANLGPVLDAVVREGANRLGGIQFGFQAPEPLMDAARRAAVEQARAKAMLYADAAGVVLGPLMTLSEQGGGIPRPERMQMAASDAGIPISPGEMTLRAQVTMVYQIAE